MCSTALKHSKSWWGLGMHHCFKVTAILSDWANWLYLQDIIFCLSAPAYCTPLHYNALSPAQTVRKLSVTSWRKEGRRMSERSLRRRQCLIMTLWMIHGVPVVDHRPKFQWVTFSRFSLFQNLAAMSLKVDEHFRSLTTMWKVDFLWIWTVSKCIDYLSIKVIVLKYTPDFLEDMKPLYPRLASRYVFQPPVFCNEKYFICPLVHVTGI